MRVYLAGGVDKAPDLGVGIRLEAQRALEAVGLEAVWPDDLRHVAPATVMKVRHAWASAIEAWKRDRKQGQRHPIAFDTDTIHGCDAVLVLLDRHAGKGTRLEVELARYLELPTAIVRLGNDPLSEEGLDVWVRLVEDTSRRFASIGDAVEWLRTRG